MSTATTIKNVPSTGLERWIDVAETGQPSTWWNAVRNEGFSGVIIDCMTDGWVTNYRNALAAGRAVMLLQGYYEPAWSVPADAAQRAKMAVGLAQSVNYPRGATIWLDVENAMNVTAAELFTWVQNWSLVLGMSGYGAGAYIGTQQPMTGEQWWEEPHLTHYWKGWNSPIVVPHRGFQIEQTALSSDVAGFAVDTDIIQKDAMGGEAVAAKSVVVTPTVTAAPAPTTLSKLAAQVAVLSKDVVINAVADHQAIAALQTQVKDIQGVLADVHDDLVDVRGAVDELAMVFDQLGSALGAVVTKMGNR